MTDPFVGTLTFCRIYSGVLNAGDGVYNSVKGQRERVGRMLQMHANDRTAAEWSSFCYALQEDDASSPTPQKRSQTAVVRALGRPQVRR